MYQTINKYDFEQAFKAHGRGDQFSYKALGLIFDYLEEVDENYELDVVAICCEYTEDTIEGVASSYDIDIEGFDDDEQRDAVRDYLENSTSIVGETSDGFVYVNF